MTAYAAAGVMRSRRRLVLVVGAMAGCTVGIATAALLLGSPITFLLLVGAAVAVTVWAAPWTGVVGMVLIGTIIEQFSLVAEGTISDGTDHLLLFQSFNAYGVSGLYASPFELFLVLVVSTWLIKGFATRTLRLPASAMGASVAVFAAVVALGFARGLTAGGSPQVALLELRPWLYLTIAFVAASQLIASRRQLMAVLGAMVVGISIKGIQGVITLVTHFTSRPPQAILAHEESFFFGIYMAVLAALWLVPVKGRLRNFMTLLFPFVLVADIANERRTAWAIAAVALAAVFAVGFFAFPERRKTVVWLGIAGLVLAGIYWVGFSNDPGLLGQPARAVLSQLAPTARDQSSNQYRVVENVNLGIGIRSFMPFGMGFGHPIPQAVPNVDISNVDSFISYLPHNTVLYVWLRLGIFGITAFWMMIGISLMSAVNSLRARPNTATLLISFTLIVALLGYVVQGFYDMGLYWFRMAVVVGCLMGAMDAARRLDAKAAAATQPTPPRKASGLGRSRRELESAA